MKQIMKQILNREVRKWIYIVGVAAVPVLIHYGVMDVEAGPIILPFLLALLNLTPKDNPDLPGGRYGA